MSSSHLERKYNCWNDCQMGGCPGHTATLDFQSVSDHLWFKDGKGGEYGGNPVEFEILLSMIVELSGWRVEAQSLIKRAGLEPPKMNIDLAKEGKL